MVTTPEIDEDLLFPSSDGNPMADNTEQYNWIVLIKENLESLFFDNDHVFIAGDLLWYPVYSVKAPSAAPDVMVVFGRPKGPRKSYKQWREDNIPPQVVFEILSESNTKKKMAEKLRFYQSYGVEEYYIYDPEEYILTVRMRDGNELKEVPVEREWISPRLGIKFDKSQGELIIYTPNGQEFLSPSGSIVEARVQRQIAEQERQRAEQAEHRARILAEQLKALGIDPDNLPSQI